MPNYTAYYRVSTVKQGRSGLGLEAQREAVARFIGRAPVSEFTEIESGRRHENRPQLKAAMEECKKFRRKLVIAKLDRLARNVHFVSGLMESGVDFVAADQAHAEQVTDRFRPGERPAVKTSEIPSVDHRPTMKRPRAALAENEF